MFSEFARIFVIFPLRTLYFRGPALMQWGFWHNTEPHDICAQVTSISASSWTSDDIHKAECTKLLEKKFDTFFVGTAVAAYIWTAFTALSNLCTRVLVVNPILKALRQEAKHEPKQEAKHEARKE